MQTSAPMPPPIPYIDHHAGERRVLWLTLDHRAVQSAPTVGVDGRPFVVPWPRCAFEVPADRPVHLSVHLQSGDRAFAAAVLVPPSAPPELVYRISALAGTAFLGWPGQPGSAG